jgi:hypothetical protein
VQQGEFSCYNSSKTLHTFLLNKFVDKEVDDRSMSTLDFPNNGLSGSARMFLNERTFNDEVQAQ